MPPPWPPGGVVEVLRKMVRHIMRLDVQWALRARTGPAESLHMKLATGHMYFCLYLRLSLCAAHQWGTRDRAAYTGYNGKQMDCASAQSFGAF